MGINKTPNEFGRESPANGHNRLYSADHWSAYILNKRPHNAKAKRVVVFLSIDVVAIITVLGIIKNLSNVKEVIALIVAIAWIGGRAVIIWMKTMSFWGKNSEAIKKGIREFKKLFKE